MILIDTGPIVALFDKDDRYHVLCVEILKEIREPLITTCYNMARPHRMLLPVKFFMGSSG